jgi:hypothetical protein
MKTTDILLIPSLALVSAFAPVAVPATTTTLTIADEDPSGLIAVTDVSRRGNVVTGILVNRGSDELRNVRLLVDIAFLWANEFSPGDDSPGRAVVLTVPGPIAPNARLAFELTPNPPLPERTDGRYADPKVHVMGYTHVAAR